MRLRLVGGDAARIAGGGHHAAGDDGRDEGAEPWPPGRPCRWRSATLLAVLGGLGLLLASIGLYVVVAFAVTRRTREIGVRIALGAGSQQVVWNIARGVAGSICVGTGIGARLALAPLMLALRTLLLGQYRDRQHLGAGLPSRSSTRWRCWRSPP